MNFFKKITLADSQYELKKIALDSMFLPKDKATQKIFLSAWKNRTLFQSASDEASLAQKIFMASSLLNSSLDIEKQFPKFAEIVHEIIPFERLAIATLNNAEKNFTIIAAKMLNDSSDFCERGSVMPYEKTSMGWVCETKKALIINDYFKNKQFVEDDMLERSGLRSGVRVPLVYNEEIIGVLMLNSNKPGAYTNSNLRILKLLAGQIAAFIKNAKLYERLRQKKFELDKASKKQMILNSLAEILNQQHSTEAVISMALGKILSLTGYQLGAIYLLHERKNTLEIVASKGLSTEFFKTMQKIVVGKLPTGKAAAIGKTIVISDMANYERNPGIRIKEGIKSAVFIPLRTKKRVIGVMPLASKHRKEFTTDEIQLLESLSNYFALAIERLSMLEKLNGLAMIDSLSGLYNRRTFYNELETQLMRATRYNEKFSVIMLDIDFFKKYNDSFGHVSGDKLLKKLGTIIKRSIREGDIAARFGGEEFVILSYGTNSIEAYNQAERLRNTVQEKCMIENVTISLGIAAYPEHGKDVETLLKKADYALYEAKKCNRNCVKVFQNMS